MDEEVAMQFVAEVEQAVASVRELAAAAQELAAAAKEAQDGVAGIAAPAGEAAAATKELADSGTAAAAGASEVADGAGKAAGSLDIYTDAAGRARLANGQFASSAQVAAAGAAEAGTAAKGAADDAAAAADTTAASAGKAGAAGDAAAAGGLAKYKMALVGTAVAVGVAVDAAAKFQDQTTHLVTDAGESAKNLAMVQQGILSVSSATATSASSITDAMYHIESSGFHGAQGLAILKTTAEGARVGGADLDTTSKALMGTLTAYYGTSMTAAQATQRSTAMMNELITTVGSGDMRMQDLAASIHSVAPAAAAAHISFAEVGGALAVMTAQGMSAQQATQNLGHVIGSLNNPTNVQSNEMRALGLNANEVSKNLGKVGLSGTIDELRDAVLRNTKGGSVMLDMIRGMSPAAQTLADKILAGTISTHDLTSAMKELNPQQYALVSHFKTAAVSVTGMQQTYSAAMSKMMGGQMGLNVGLMLTGTHMKDVATATANIAAEGAKASSTVDNWSKIQGTLKFQLEQATVSIKNSGIALGTILLPAVSAVVGPLARFLAAIAGNKAEATALAIVIGAVLAGAIGTKAVKAVTEFKSAVETTVGGVSKLVKAITGIGKAQEAAAAASDASAATQEADAAGVAVANEEAAAKSSGSWVASSAKAVAAAAVWVAQSVAKVAVVVASNVAGAASTLAAWVATGAGMVAQAAVWVAGTIAKVAVVVGANIAGALATGAAWVIANGIMLLGIGLVVAAVALAVYEIVKHWSAIVHGAEDAWNAVYHAVSVAVSAVINFVKQNWMLMLGILLGPIALAVALIIKYWGDIQHGASVVIEAVAGFFKALPGRIKSFFESLPGDMLAIGQNIVHGLVNGVQSMGSFLVNAIEDLIPSPIRSIVSTALGIFSPSTVFHGYGVNIVQGLVNGVRSMRGTLAGTMNALTGTVTDAGSAYAASAIAPAGTVTHNVNVNVQGATVSGLTDPRYEQDLYAAVQEVTLRHAQLNPTNGFTPAWGR